MRVVIIGAGVIGCAVALELARRGVSPVVLDRLGAVGHGSTSASSAIVRRYYSNRTLIAMSLEASEIWSEWGGYLGVDDPERGLARFHRPGMLVIPTAMDEGIKQVESYMREVGVEVERLSKEELGRRFPYFSLASHSPVRQPTDPDFFDDTGRELEGALFEHGAGYVVSATQATHNLRVAAEHHGADFRLKHEVTGIERAPSGALRLSLADGPTIEADAVLNAAGPHSTVVNRLAGVTFAVDLQPLRREVHAVDNPVFDEATGSSPMPVVADLDSGIYFLPESGGRTILVGGLEPECDPMEWVEDPDVWSEVITVPEFEQQVLRLMKRFPAVSLGKRRGVVGLYDTSVVDWTPILDRTELPGFYVAVGTSGSSFKTAPVIGRLMAELILACQAGHDHDAEPLKVALPRTGFEVDLGFFSRHRQPHDTSGTVIG